ncbi:hypothetical protein CPT03_16950 [Pedobacter ginsengisoli]|uniref:Uncharacterized protein n=1 Tax=Pedobacter ginsengisoli TaxID=363852 RepID=A0A2D1U8U4_9SPHI|nr:hypothetical protein [Pedobacter ginsengisoli]ATP58033.1 hypothetical protein CPT03_16950 [Pedobacter ginsengisoli]
MTRIKKALFLFILGIISFKTYGQVTTIAPGYKNIVIPAYTPIGNYSKVVILLHEAYSGTIIGANHAIGTITALRGSVTGSNRLNVANLNTSAAYTTTTASVISDYNNASPWKLKRCLFNGKRYLALEVPYRASYFNQGFKFMGWTISTAENMLAIPYEKDGLPLNEDVLSEIEDFTPNQTETHDVQNFSVFGNVGIGTLAPSEKLSVKGKIRAQEIKVETANWPDYVFAKGYKLPSLKETEKHIAEKGHLPDIPSAEEVKANGVDLGEMNAKLLKKIEELTLYLIELKKEVEILKSNK